MTVFREQPNGINASEEVWIPTIPSAVAMASHVGQPLMLMEEGGLPPPFTLETKPARAASSTRTGELE